MNIYETRVLLSDILAMVVPSLITILKFLRPVMHGSRLTVLLDLVWFGMSDLDGSKVRVYFSLSWHGTILVLPGSQYSATPPQT